VSMVCSLTIGKEKYQDVESELAQLLTRSERLRRRLTELLEADTQVYSAVSAAYRLPRGTDEEKAKRSAAIQAALIEASQVPLQIAQACAEVMELSLPAAAKGNSSAVSDAGVAVLLAEAAMRGAALNVSINLASIKDGHFVRETRQSLEAAFADKEAIKQQVLRLVEERM
jgi:formiminotetrahydrofolate cyclodeaminase